MWVPSSMAMMKIGNFFFYLLENKLLNMYCVSGVAWAREAEMKKVISA